MQHTVYVYIVSWYISTHNMESTIIHIQRLPARTLHHILKRTLQLTLQHALQHALHHKTWRAQSYTSGNCLHAHCITYWNAHCNSHCNTHCNTHCTTKHREHNHTHPAIACTHTASHTETHTATHTATRTATRTAPQNMESTIIHIRRLPPRKQAQIYLI